MRMSCRWGRCAKSVTEATFYDDKNVTPNEHKCTAFFVVFSRCGDASFLLGLIFQALCRSVHKCFQPQYVVGKYAVTDLIVH